MEINTGQQCTNVHLCTLIFDCWTSCQFLIRLEKNIYFTRLKVIESNKQSLFTSSRKTKNPQSKFFARSDGEAGPRYKNYKKCNNHLVEISGPVRLVIGTLNT